MELDTVYEKRFTPTVEEVELAESILREEWKTIEPNKKFKDFSRQYAGVVDNEGKELEGEVEGNLCISDSWPGQMRSVYGDHKRFKETYFSDLSINFLNKIINAEKLNNFFQRFSRLLFELCVIFLVFF